MLFYSINWTRKASYFFLQSHFKWFLGGCGQKWAWSFSSWDPKICYIWRVYLWIELIFCMLTVRQVLVRLALYSIFLTLKCQYTAVVFVGTLGVVRRVLWNSLSVLPSCCLLGYFLGIGSLDFSEFRHYTRNP